MSKELESLKQFQYLVVAENDAGSFVMFKDTEEYNDIKQALQELETLKKQNRNAYKEGYEQGKFDERMTNIDNRPPTADDVCKLYELLYRTPLIYNKTMKRFEEIKGGRAKGRYIATLYPFGLKIYHPFKLHLITLIGRFYESEVKGE
jgi:hypothetical protein